MDINNLSNKRKYNSSKKEISNKKIKIEDNIVNEVRQLFLTYNNIINIFKSGSEEEKYKLRETYSNEDLKYIYKEYENIINLYYKYLYRERENSINTYYKYSFGCNLISLSLEFNKRNDIIEELKTIILSYCKEIDNYKTIKNPSISDKVNNIWNETIYLEKITLLCKNTDINYALYLLHIPEFNSKKFINIMQESSKIFNIIMDQMKLENSRNIINKEYINYTPTIFDKIKEQFGYVIQKQVMIEKKYRQIYYF